MLLSYATLAASHLLEMRCLQIAPDAMNRFTTHSCVTPEVFSAYTAMLETMPKFVVDAVDLIPMVAHVVVQQDLFAKFATPKQKLSVE